MSQGGRERVGQFLDRRLDEAGDRRLADPAQRQGGDRDADLAGREVGIEVVHDLLCRRRRHAAVVRRLLQPRAAHRDDGELRRYEEAVDKDEEDDQEDADQWREVHTAGILTISCLAVQRRRRPPP